MNATATAEGITLLASIAAGLAEEIAARCDLPDFDCELTASNRQASLKYESTNQDGWCCFMVYVDGGTVGVGIPQFNTLELADPGLLEQLADVVTRTATTLRERVKAGSVVADGSLRNSGNLLAPLARACCWLVWAAGQPPLWLSERLPLRASLAFAACTSSLAVWSVATLWRALR